MFTILYATLHNYQKALIHKSEPRVNPTLINHVNMVYELKAKTIRAHRSVGSLIIQFWSWFNIPLQRIKCTLIPYINNNKIKLKPMTYYPLHANSSCTSVYNLTRQCYHLSKLPLKSLSYKSDLLCDRLTYSNSKEYMSNSIKWIIAIIDFMITCPLDHPKDTLSQSHEISWCLYWEYLSIVTHFHQRWPNS